MTTWSTTSDAPGVMDDGWAVEFDGKLYAKNGYDDDSPVYCYDPGTDSWTSQTLPYQVEKHSTAAVVIGDRIWIYGLEPGAGYWDGPWAWHAWDPVTNTFTDRRVDPYKPIGAGGLYINRQAGCYLDGKLYLTHSSNNYSFSPPQDDGGLLILDLATDTWSLSAGVGWDPSGGPLVTDGTYLYWLEDNGYAPDGTTYSGDYRTWRYDPATDTWDTTLATDPQGRYAGDAVFYNGRIIVAGGENNTSPEADGYTTRWMSSYDIASDTWDILDPFVTPPRSQNAATLLGSQMYIVGGYNYIGPGDTFDEPPTAVSTDLAVLYPESTPGFTRSGVPPRSTPFVWTADPGADAADRVYLDQLGAVSGLRDSHQWPGGCKSLSCTLDVPPEFSHRALTPGRDVGVTVGAEDVWLGTLNAPTVAEDGRRQITADGDSAAVAHFVALGLGTHNALNANEVVDAAQLSGRHSRFRRVDTFPVPDGQRADDAAFMMDESLTQAANAAGKRWRVDLDRVVRMYPYTGDGQQLQLRARQDIGRTLDGFVTRFDAAFIDAETGLYRVEHLDASPADTGSTYYPAFYTPDGSAYAAGGFTLYTDGTTITAYVIGKPATATVLSLSSPAVDLALVETSQFYSRFAGAGSLAPGATGRTGTYRATTGSPSLGTGSQEGIAHRGAGSLQATGNIPPREAVVDLTSQGAFTQAQVLEQLAQHMRRAKSQPHYDGTWTVDQGDLLTMGGVPVDLATVRAGVQVLVVAVDPTRNLSLQADDVWVTIGETEYDADTGTLQLTPDASPDLPEKTATVDFATGLVRS